jgi:hypothetical protein
MPPTLPLWTTHELITHLRDNLRRYESLVNTGAYHHLLPASLRWYNFLTQFDLPRFEALLARLRLHRADERTAARLLALGVASG